MIDLNQSIADHRRTWWDVVYIEPTGTRTHMCATADAARRVVADLDQRKLTVIGVWRVDQVATVVTRAELAGS